MRKNQVNGFSKIIKKDEHFSRLLLLLIALFAIMSVIKPDLFLTAGNFQSMAKQFPEYGLLAFGISLALITGGIDLSVVNIANLSAIISAKFMLATITPDMPTSQIIIYILITVLISLAIGFLAGMFNGILISKIGIPAILATLGTGQLYMGIAIVITEGKATSGLPPLYSKIINTSVFGKIPVVLIIFIVFSIIVGLILAKTKTGGRIYLLGTNPKATRFAGINNDNIILFVYILSGVLAAVAGLIMMGRANSVKPDYGVSYTMQCVLIAVLGGVSPTGGKGNIKSVVVAIVTLQLLSSFINMFEKVSNFYRDVLWGGLLILMLIFNYLMANREKAKYRLLE